MRQAIRHWVRRMFLRGRLLEAWHLNKSRRLERAYCRQLLGLAAQPVPAPVQLNLPRRRAVRSILLIADVMWELDQLVPELRKIGQVSLLDLHPALERRPPGPSRIEAVARAVEDFARVQKSLDPDVILFYARPSILSDAAFEHLRRRWSCPLLGMNLDDKTQFFPYGIFSAGDDNYRHWAAKFDLNITSAPAAVDWYHHSGLPCIYVPPGFHLPEDLPPPGPEPRFNYTLSFVGSCRLERKLIIDQLLALGLPITLFGQGWPTSQWAQRPAQIYRASQLNLGIGLCTASGGMTNLKARDFECPGVGACYLTTYNWELLQHWDAGREILFYRTVEELVEVYTYYRRRPQDCLRIAQAAYRRAAAEHTWEKRFRTLFAQAGILA